MTTDVERIGCYRLLHYAKTDPALICYWKLNRILSRTGPYPQYPLSILHFYFRVHVPCNVDTYLST
jgi:hypothetical protein